MLRVRIFGQVNEGKSTLAVIIAQALTVAGIPFVVSDSPPEAGDAHSLGLDADERLARNTFGIAEREKVMGRKVLIETVSTSPGIKSPTDGGVKLQLDPRATKGNVARAIRAAQKELGTGRHVSVDTGGVVFSADPEMSHDAVLRILEH